VTMLPVRVHDATRVGDGEAVCGAGDGAPLWAGGGGDGATVVALGATALDEVASKAAVDGGSGALEQADIAINASNAASCVRCTVSAFRGAARQAGRILIRRSGAVTGWVEIRTNPRHVPIVRLVMAPHSGSR